MDEIGHLLSLLADAGGGSPPRPIFALRLHGAQATTQRGPKLEKIVASVARHFCAGTAALAAGLLLTGMEAGAAPPPYAPVTTAQLVNAQSS